MTSKRAARRRRFLQRRFREEFNRNKLAQPGPHELVVVIDKMKPNFNIGKIFRTADAFGAREIHLVGIEQFDPCTARGSIRYVPAHFHETFADVHTLLTARGYTLLALDPETDDQLPGFALPRQSAFVIGHEEYGFSYDPADFPDVRPLNIPQFGKVQSLNASVAASLAMYEWLSQHVFATQETTNE